MRFQVNDLVQCQVREAFSHHFFGRITKLYERSALVEIIEHHRTDRWKAIELTNRTVVAFKNLQPIMSPIPVNLEMEPVLGRQRLNLDQRA